MQLPPQSSFRMLHHRKILSCLFVVIPGFHLLLQATTDLFPVSIVLPFLEIQSKCNHTNIVLHIWLLSFILFSKIIKCYFWLCAGFCHVFQLASFNTSVHNSRKNQCFGFFPHLNIFIIALTRSCRS